VGVLLDENTRVVIQGFGGAGQREARNSLNYGTKVVCGVTPGRGGQEIEGVPIRNTVEQAVKEFDANVSLIFVPAAFAADAILEAADAGIPVAICITEGIATRDMVAVKRYLGSSKTTLIGPNCPGVITPMARARAGIMPPDVYLPGNVGVISRSGTLVYETVDQLTRLGIGQSSSVGVGGDPIIGTTQREALELFEADPDTAAVVMIGEIGGTSEQEAAGSRRLHQDHVEARRRLHRGCDRASRPPHGPRRRDHRRQGRHRAGEADRTDGRRRDGVAVALADRRDDAARAQGARAGVGRPRAGLSATSPDPCLRP
jgi:succinyl-CoA synthetase alpha subunit